MSKIVSAGWRAAVVVSLSLLSACSGGGPGDAGGSIGGGTGGSIGGGTGDSTGGGTGGSTGGGTGGSMGGGTGGSTGGGTGGSTGGGTGGSTGGGTGGSTGGGTGGSTGGGDASTTGGAITLTQSSTTYVDPDGGVTFYSGLGSVAFYDQLVQRSGCVTSTVSGCTVVECGPDAGVPIALPRQVSAGLLTISGPSLAIPDAGTLSVAFIPDAGYPPFGTASRIWTEGDALAVTADGAIVPAFTAHVTAPGTPVLTAPVCASSDCGTLNRSAPLLVSWTGNSSMTIELQWMAGGRSIQLTCDLASSPATIDAAVMARLGTTDGGVLSSLSFTSSNTTRFLAGEYSVDLTATSVGEGGGRFTTSD